MTKLPRTLEPEMAFDDQSAEVLDKVRELYHEAVVNTISGALLKAIRFGWELAQRQEPK